MVEGKHWRKGIGESAKQGSKSRAVLFIAKKGCVKKLKNKKGKINKVQNIRLDKRNNPKMAQRDWDLCTSVRGACHRNQRLKM